MQSQVELIRINFKFEAPIIQVQIITYIIYLNCACVWRQLGCKNNGNINILTHFSSHSRQVYIATWVFVLPIDKENPYRLSRGWYIYIYIYVEFLASHFGDLSRCISKFTGWATKEELSIRRRLHTFLISCGQKTHVKHCYVDVSSWCDFWFAMICISINIILDLSTTIRDGFDSLPVYGSTRDFFFKYNDRE